LALGEQIAKRVARDKRLAEREKRARPASVKLPQGKGEPLAQGVGVANFTAGFGQSGFGRNNPGGDNGPALVELIQRTIAPTSWDVNGGPGSIYYWYPGHALVIRQMDSVHEDIDGLLRQLERANR
jgi:hypothetical protein